MLVLTRKYQEKIRIGNNITITILRMKGKAVRLGIEAPAEVPVIRGELAFDEKAESLESEQPAQAEFEVVTSEEQPRAGRTFAGAGSIKTNWPAESRSNRGGSLPDRREPATIEFSRVLREEVANLLPKLAAGSAPLRAAMELGRS